MFNLMLMVWGVAAWARAFGTPDHEQAQSLVPLEDVLAVGGVYWGSGFNNGLVAIMSPSGDIQWALSLANVLEGYPVSVELSLDSSLFVVSSVPNNTVGPGYGFMTKMSQQGDIIWTRRYYTPLETRLTRPTKVLDSVMVIPGSVLGNTGPVPIVWKVSALDGRKLWCVMLEGVNGQANCGSWFSQDQVLVLGNGQIGGQESGFAACLDDAGSLIWAVNLGQGFVPLDAITTQDSAVVFCGYYSYFYGLHQRLFVAKINRTGQVLWCVGTVDSTGTKAYSINQTANGNLLVSGYDENITPGAKQAMLLELDQDGNPVNQMAFTPDAQGEFNCAVELGQTRLMLGGTNTVGSGGVDLLALSTDSTGQFPGCTEVYTPLMQDLPMSSDSLGLSQPYIYSNYETISISASYMTLGTNDACVDVAETGAPSNRDSYCVGVSRALVFWLNRPETVKVYSADGRLILERPMTSGHHKLPWATGTYFWQTGSNRGVSVVLP